MSPSMDNITVEHWVLLAIRQLLPAPFSPSVYTLDGMVGLKWEWEKYNDTAGRERVRQIWHGKISS